MLQGVDALQFVSDDFYLLGRVASEGLFLSWGGADGLAVFRPLTVLTYLIDFRIWGMDPAAFHAVNLLLHLSCSFLLYLLSRSLIPGAGKYRAAMAGLLFATLASHTESIFWVSGRTDILAALFSMGSLLAWCRGHMIAAILLLSCGLLSKESALVVPLLWMLAPGRQAGWKRETQAATLVLGAYVAARCLINPSFLRLTASGEGFSSPGWNLCENLVRFSLRALSPPLAVTGPELLIRAAPIAMVAMVLVLSTRELWTGRSLVLPVLLCFFAALLPVIRMRVAILDTQGERLLYLPGAFAVMSLVGCSVRAGRKGRVVDAVLVLLVGLHAWNLTRLRDSWVVAGRLCSEIAASVALHDPDSTVLLGIPDNYRGAYVYRNGLDEAVALAGGSGVYSVVATIGLTSLGDTVEVLLEGDTALMRLPAGAELCLLDTLGFDASMSGGAVRIILPENLPDILFFDGSSMRDAESPGGGARRPPVIVRTTRRSP